MSLDVGESAVRVSIFNRRCYSFDLFFALITRTILFGLSRIWMAV